jgi:uncharacterized Zn finger protein/nucleoid DNA-binding protein
MPYDDGDWPAYVTVAERRRDAAVALAKLRKSGQKPAPVKIEGRAIATTFWGKAWCSNLESYRDYESRLPRGRSYVRNGSVLDLQLGAGEVKALVSGSSLYRVTIGIAPVPERQWRDICMDCAGRIDSLVELLQGKLSKSVMERICRQQTGLFPTPAEITLRCSCLDHASMCKHVAAVLYGVGARLDRSPELLFDLRAVKQQDLLAAVEDAAPVTEAPRGRILGGDDLSALFGIEMAGAAEVGSQATPRAPAGTFAPPRRAMAASAPSGVKRARPAASSIKAAVAGKDIAAQLAASNGLSKKESEKLVADLAALIADHLAAGKSVTLTGLGSLAISERDVRFGRNPMTGEVIRLAGKREFVFRPAKGLKASI